MIKVSNSIGQSEIKDLIYSQQIISNGHLVNHLNDFDPQSYRILDRPFLQLLVDDLIAGSWTIEELASKYGVEKDDVRTILLPLMNNIAAFDGGYIPRRITLDDPEGNRNQHRYSYIPIPIQARIFDPTLGFSLLGWSEFLKNEGIAVNTPDDDQKMAYFKNLTSYWEIPEDKILNYLDSEGMLFVDTVYGPLPVLTNQSLYQQIREKFTEDANVLAKKYNNRNLKKDYEYYRALLNQGPGSIPDFQYCVVTLCDTLNYCRSYDLQNEYKQFQAINRCLLKMITLKLDMSAITLPDSFPKKTAKKSKFQKSPARVQKHTVPKKKSVPTNLPNKHIQSEPIITKPITTKLPKQSHAKENSHLMIISIMPLLHSPDSRVQIKAIERLSSIKDDDVLKLLRKKLSDDQILVREACVRSLEKIGSPQALLILESHLKSESSAFVRGIIERILK